MRPDQEDEQLRAWFSESKADDQRDAPPFEQTWRTAVGRQRAAAAGPIAYRRLAAAVLVLAASVAAVVFVTRDHPKKVATALTTPQSTGAILQTTGSLPDSSITQWQSPTAFLLELADDSASPTNRSQHRGPPTRQTF